MKKSSIRNVLLGTVSVVSLVAAMAAVTSAGLSISDVRARHVTATEATVTWLANKPSTSKVYYSAETPVTFETALVATGGTGEACIKGRTEVFKQTVLLAGLFPETTYYYVVESEDLTGTYATTSSELSFATKSAPNGPSATGASVELEYAGVRCN